MHTQTAAHPRAPLLEACCQGLRYAAYTDSVGGVILARLGDGHSTYFQPGAEAHGFWSGVYAAQDVAPNEEADAFDRACVEFDGLLMDSESMHGQPADPHGDFWRWAA